MGLIGIISISLGSLVLLLILVGFFLPRKVHVARSIIIDGSKEDIFPHLNNLKLFVEWSPWTEKDPNMTQNFSGPESGIACTYQWEGDKKKVGTGSMIITNSVHNERVETDLNFGKQGTAQANWILESKDSKTKVIWTLDTDMGINPVGRYFGLFMDKMIGPDYEHGLNKLKAKLENK